MHTLMQSEDLSTTSEATAPIEPSDKPTDNELVSAIQDTNEDELGEEEKRRRR